MTPTFWNAARRQHEILPTCVMCLDTTIDKQKISTVLRLHNNKVSHMYNSVHKHNTLTLWDFPVTLFLLLTTILNFSGQKPATEAEWRETWGIWLATMADLVLKLKKDNNK